MLVEIILSIIMGLLIPITILKKPIDDDPY